MGKSLASLPGVKRFFPGAPESIDHVGDLIDLFSTFALIDGKIEYNETHVILDLLRHTYPEADHGWLSRRLASAFKKSLPLEQQAERLSSQLSKEALTTLGLQLYLLLESSTHSSKGDQAFTTFMRLISQEHEGEALIHAFKHFLYPHTDLSVETLTLGQEGADILLTEDSANIRCKAFRSNNTLIIQNAGEEPLLLGGSVFPPQASIRIRSHQRLQLPEWDLSFTDLNFLLDAKYKEESRTIHLSLNNDELLVEKNKSRHSFARIHFSLSTQVHILAPSELTLPNQTELHPGENYDLPHYAHIQHGSGRSLSLTQLRLQAIDSGARLLLQRKQQSCLISNKDQQTDKEFLKLSPGLSEPVTLQINYNQESGKGTLEILESGAFNILVNEKTTTAKMDLEDGCLIRISPNQGIRCRFSEGLLDEERTVVEQLQVDGLTHHFGSKTVLDNIDFSLNRGEMLCIMGPSGSGKSTLLSALSGQLKPSRGHVRLNQISLYQHLSRLSGFLTYMPQEEALAPSLTVREHLKYAVNIRQPQLKTCEVQRWIDTILDELSLQPLSNRKVGEAGDKSLSGGERSRLNLGLDLGSKAEVYLFDEPISGLSSKDSEHVIESLKNISRDKIVIASLHRPGAKILSQFNKVLLLDKGGRVVFFGSPALMRDYFKDATKELQITVTANENVHSADFIFDVLETPLVDIIPSRSFAGTRRFPPLFWQERFESYALIQDVKKGDVPALTSLGDIPRAEDNMPIPQREERHFNAYLRIFQAHFLRSCLSKYRNKGTLYATFLETPLLAFIISWTLRASPDGAYAFHSGLHIVTYLFLSVTVGMFLGLTNSATEILRDRPTLRRERNYKYSNFLFIAAKFSSLSVLVAIQCAIYLLIGNSMLEIQDMWLPHWLWMTVTAMSGTAIALFISTFVKTERAALSAVPLVLVPQLLLAGTPLIPFEEMNRGLFSGAEESRQEGKEPILSRIIPLRYAYEGVTVDQATCNTFEKNRREINQAVQELKDKERFAMTHLNEGISDEESERLAVLLKALTKLYASQARDAKEASELLQSIRDAGMKGDKIALDNIKFPEKGEPCDTFFVNQRAEQLVQRQDIQRVDLSKEKHRNIFLAEKKYFGTEANPAYTRARQHLNEQKITDNTSITPTRVKSWKTVSVCFSVLLGLSFTLLTITTVWLSRSNNKLS